MIETLHIENLAIVEDALLELGPGLNVLTGETGAGKSIILGALSLLAGGRAASGSLREGAESGLVEAVLCTRDLPELEARLQASGFEPDDHELVVSRSFAGGGRSRARVAGELVPISSLAELFGDRIEISSQHSSQALLHTESHGLYLDRGGGLTALRGRVEDGYARLRALTAELAELREQAEERLRRRDFLTFQLSEIDAGELRAGELESLQALHSRLAHAERLREEGSAAYVALVGDPISGGAGAAADDVRAALRLLEGLQKLDPALAPFVAGLRSIEMELQETALELERYIDGVEADPQGLNAVEERLAQVERLRRKYGGTVEEILAYREGAASELETLEGLDERAEALVAERERCAGELAAAAEELSGRRATAARELQRQVESSLRGLGIPRARFEVCLVPAKAPDGAPCGPAGKEAPEFRFSANLGEALRPLTRVASGGELSRVFLAVRNALRSFGEGMVLVFDEVDADVGGGAAERMGRSLDELARHHQVLCITHLPQIAAFADVHFCVRKREGGGRTRALVERIEGRARIDEIARMAGGEAVTSVTRRHAEALLKAKSPAEAGRQPRP